MDKSQQMARVGLCKTSSVIPVVLTTRNHKIVRDGSVGRAVQIKNIDHGKEILFRGTHNLTRGSHEEFLALRQAYEQALKMCQED